MNVELFRMINNLGKEYQILNPVFVFIAEYTILLLAAVVLFYLISGKPGSRLMVGSGLLSVVIAIALGKFAGLFHSNNQPFAELANVNQLVEKSVNNSFPSDHTIIFFTMAVTFWLFKRKHNYLWIVLAVLVGLSRVGVGVHYPADVAVGASIGAATAYLGFLLIPGLFKNRTKVGVSEKETKNI
ncbi:undecaprenyl-diphosphatase [Mesobacillus subterraneus]|nr:undecaprenyl-diphosphatase [Mesobacillus subterraneus]